MPRLQGENILAIILGASEWPNYPGLHSSPAFHNSAKGFLAYLKDILALSEDNILWLFNDQDSPTGIDTRIRRFLQERVSGRDIMVTDLILYYTGHGRKAVPDRKFQVILQSTDKEAVSVSAYKMEDLANSLNRCARGLRKWIFLDCCSSAAAYPDLQPLDSEIAATMREEKHKFEVIKEIIDQGKAHNQAEITQQTIMAATNQGDLDAVRQLIAQGADVNTVYPHMNSFLDGHTPLLVAARDGHTDIVRALLQAGAQVRVEDWVFKGTPIHKATYTGNPEILKMLVEHPDIDLDVQGPINGYTPLHDALWHGFTECAEILVKAGARLDLRGHDGKLPIDVAIEVCGAASEIVKLIQSQGQSASMDS